MKYTKERIQEICGLVHAKTKYGILGLCGIMRWLQFHGKISPNEHYDFIEALQVWRKNNNAEYSLYVFPLGDEYVNDRIDLLRELLGSVE